MTIGIKSRQGVFVLIAVTSIGLLPMMSFAKTKPIMTTDLLQHLKKGEPWDRGVLAATKMVMFQQQSASSGQNATSVSKITLAYFASSDCTGSTVNGFYTTSSGGPSFPISVGKTFGMVAASVWKVGNAKLGITNVNMANIKSIAVTLKSTSGTTPQSCFNCVTSSPSRSSFACVSVTCTAGPGGQCTSTNSTQFFQLKTTAAIGDPADGGVIACMDTGNNLVVPTTDNSPLGWAISSSSTRKTNATSITDGSTNTTNIVQTLGVGNYAAITCSSYSAAGGYTSGWFLPAGNNTTSTGQLHCLYKNLAAIGGFSTSSNYWSSTEQSSGSSFPNAWAENFGNGTQSYLNKTTSYPFRCARSFTP